MTAASTPSGPGAAGDERYRRSPGGPGRLPRDQPWRL